MKHCTWNIRSLYRAGSLKTALARYKLDLVGVQEVKWDKVIIFFCVKLKETRQLGTGFCVHHRIVSAFKKVGYVCDRTSYIVLRGGWCNIIVLKLHAPSEKKNGDSKAKFMRKESSFFFLSF
jgi:exonuclease III